MKILYEIYHFFRKERCLDSLDISHGSIKCNKCGREIGFYFLVGDTFGFNVFYPYIKYKAEIREMVLGQLNNEEE